MGKPSPSPEQEHCLCVLRELRQHRTEMGCDKERERADELHAGTCSNTQLGTVVHESIMQTCAAVRWWEQKEQQHVGMSTRPQEVPHMQKTVRPAAPSRPAKEEDCSSAASQRLSCAVCGRRRAEQAGRQSVNGCHSWQRVAPTAHRPNCQGSKPGRGAAVQPPQTCTCTCMRPPAHEGLQRPKQGQRCWDNKPRSLLHCLCPAECIVSAVRQRDPRGMHRSQSSTA